MSKKGNHKPTAINDNQAPKVKETNKLLGWVILVGLLVVGIYFSFY